MARQKELYSGFEQGPIRPPSEAYSLLIRITRNCPWNQCRFCYIYDNTKFSIRPVEHVKRDIDSVYKFVEAFEHNRGSDGKIYREDVQRIVEKADPDEIEALNAAGNWIASGKKSVFLQDANSLVIRAEYLLEILRHLKKRFPMIERITSYARSHTLARISPDNMKAIGEAGLNRIHVGLETGSDQLLSLVKKGSTKAMHIEAGLNVKNAGIELSEYIMPGLGGELLSETHAIETADALNQIDPHYIRLRTLLIPDDYPLFGEQSDVQFKKMTDPTIVEEIYLFTQKLEGISSTLASDHNNNLLPAVQGKLPGDKEYMLSTLQAFLALDAEEKLYFQIGRRFGFMTQVSDLNNPERVARAREIQRHYGITDKNADTIIDKYSGRSL